MVWGEAPMESAEVANARPRFSADRLALAASVCMAGGAGLFLLLRLLNALILDKYSHVTEDPVVVAGLVAMGMAYLVAPVFGILACIRLLRDRRIDTDAADSALRGRAGQRFGRAAMLFALLGFVGAYAVHTGWEMLDPPIMAYAVYVWSFVPPVLAIMLGIVSFRSVAGCRRPRLARAFTMLAVVLGLVAVLGPVAMTRGVYLIDTIRYGVKSPTFSGNSGLLQRTVVVPTLDSPCPPNKNVIWCSSFQLAWNELRDTVIGAPVQVAGAEELATRLNAAASRETDVEPGSVYAVAGRVREGVADKIREDMTAQFPSYALPDLINAELDPQGILAYSFLMLSAPFRYPFHVRRGDFAFTDSQGVKTNVSAFGAWDGPSPQYARTCEQVQILYFYPFPDVNTPGLTMTEFAVDLCKYSEPYHQVVAAVVEPKGSLAETLGYVRAQMERFRNSRWYDESITRLESVDTLVVPEMFWELDHRFDELIGRIVLNANPPAPIGEATQTIQFKLDRSGAVLTSYAIVYGSGVPRYLEFNRPFLLYMKKRGCDRPFFVMWVDNAELLTRK